MNWIKQDGRIVLPGILMMLIMGSVYSYSVFRIPIESTYGLSVIQSGLPYMLSLLFYAISMGISGKILEKVSTNLVFFLGVFLITSGWLISFFSVNLLVLSIGYGLFIGSGIGFIYGIPLMIITHKFSDRKGLYLGLVLLGFGLSPLVTAPLIQVLIDTYDLNKTFLMMSIVSFISLTGLGLFYRSFTYSKEDIEVDSLISTIKKPQFITLYILFFLATFIGLTVIGFSSSYAVIVHGFSLETSAYFVSIFAVFNGLGRVVFGRLTDKISIDKIMMLSFLALTLSSVFVILFVNNTVVFVIAFSVFWMNLGGWLAIAPATVSKIFNQKAYTRNYGVLFSAYGLSAIIGVYASAYLNELFNDYRYTFILFLLLSLIGFILSRSFRKHMA